MKTELPMEREDEDAEKVKETCENCRWWTQVNGKQEANLMGECRRYAPRPTLKPEWDENDYLVAPLAYFPLTFDDWFCGEWKLNDLMFTTVPPAPRTAATSPTAPA